MQTAVETARAAVAGLPEPARVPALDGIRGLAIILVLQFHWAEGLTRMNAVESISYAVLRAGWLGVDLFFVLSGYLITGILSDAKSRPHYFRNFYSRRVLRIFPAYYGFLFFAQFGLPALLRLAHHAPIWQDSDFGWYWLHLTNIGVVLNAPGTQGFSHFWSLALEEQFYLLWPLLLYFASRRTALRATVALIVFAPVLRTLLVLSGHPHPAVYVLMPCRLDALAIGAWIALAYREGQITPKLVRSAAIVFWVCLAVLMVIFFCSNRTLEIENHVMQTVGYSIADVLFGCVILLATQGGRLMFLTHPVLREFGKYSYVIYILHVPLHALLWKIYASSRIPDLMPTQFLSLIPFSLFASFACLGIGALSWRFYESQFLKLKSRFSD